MDKVEESICAIQYRFADKDSEAIKELELRLKKAAKEKIFITYSDLVRDVGFHLGSDKKHIIDTHQMSDFDRGLIDEYLGFLNCRSYKTKGLIISSIVVRKDSKIPSKKLLDWFQEVGLATPTSVYSVWDSEVKKIWSLHSQEVLNGN